MAEADINIDDVARHFGIHRRTAYRTNHRFCQTGLADDCPKSDRPKKKKLNPMEEHFNHITSRRERFISANLLC